MTQTINCSKCFLYRNCSVNNGFFVQKDIRCYGCLNNEEYVTLEQNVNKISTCPIFSKNDSMKSFLDLAKHIEETKEWTIFGKTDKRTAYYKSIKKFIDNGAIKYYKIYSWSEHQYEYLSGNGQPIYEFFWQRALVKYNDGTYKVHKFRELIDGKSGQDI